MEYGYSFLLQETTGAFDKVYWLRVRHATHCTALIIIIIKLLGTLSKLQAYHLWLETFTSIDSTSS